MKNSNQSNKSGGGLSDEVAKQIIENAKIVAKEQLRSWNSEPNMSVSSVDYSPAQTEQIVQNHDGAGGMESPISPTNSVSKDVGSPSTAQSPDIESPTTPSAPLPRFFPDGAGDQSPQSPQSLTNSRDVGGEVGARPSSSSTNANASETQNSVVRQR